MNNLSCLSKVDKNAWIAFKSENCKRFYKESCYNGVLIVKILKSCIYRAAKENLTNYSILLHVLRRETVMHFPWVSELGCRT